MKVVPVTTGPVRASGVPSLVNCASTTSKKISESSISECNFTAHVKVTSDPVIWLKILVLLLVKAIEDGVGTTLIDEHVHAATSITVAIN